MMVDFINTVDVLGDEAVIDGIIEKTITEYMDDVITSVGASVFEECVALKNVNLPLVTTVGGAAFNGCVSLESAEFPNCSSFGGVQVFQDCKALKSVKFPRLKTITGGQEFRRCTSLIIADFSCIEKFRMQAFLGCTALTALILRSTETVCTLDNTSALSNTPIAAGTGYIYVPRSLREQYAAATNWSTYATQLRTLEDYTVDGTTTGELDKSKI